MLGLHAWMNIHKICNNVGAKSWNVNADVTFGSKSTPKWNSARDGKINISEIITGLPATWITTNDALAYLVKVRLAEAIQQFSYVRNLITYNVKIIIENNETKKQKI